MAGYIVDFFGYRSEDCSEKALRAPASKMCPFIGSPCIKTLSRTGDVSGVCGVRQKKAESPKVICCPNRLYADNYKVLREISARAFHTTLPHFAGRTAVAKARLLGGAVAVFGKGWGGELRLPQRKGTGSYFVDWVLARLDGNGDLAEFTAVEVQTIDTTGNYRTARKSLLENRTLIPDTVGLNWENVSKRIIPQLIYKGQVLQREELCRTGLYFVSPKPVHKRVMERLGGKETLPAFPSQPASIHFVAYDYRAGAVPEDGTPVALELSEEHCTTVYKVQEAFSSVSLPEGNIYRDAIRKSLYDI